jgi:hypothetical protein
MEGITKSRLLTFLGSESLNWLQVEVVIQMEVVKILSVDEQVEHVVTLSANLKTSFYPVNLRRLEELSGLESPEEISLVESLRGLSVELIEYPALE